MIRYYIFQDLIDFDDDGDEQVSIYRTWIESEKQLTPRQVVIVLKIRRIGKSTLDKAILKKLILT